MLSYWFLFLNCIDLKSLVRLSSKYCSEKASLTKKQNSINIKVLLEALKLLFSFNHLFSISLHFYSILFIHRCLLNLSILMRNLFICCSIFLYINSCLCFHLISFQALSFSSLFFKFNLIFQLLSSKFSISSLRFLVFILS